MRFEETQVHFSESRWTVLLLKAIILHSLNTIAVESSVDHFEHWNCLSNSAKLSIDLISWIRVVYSPALGTHRYVMLCACTCLWVKLILRQSFSSYGDTLFYVTNWSPVPLQSVQSHPLIKQLSIRAKGYYISFV